MDFSGIFARGVSLVGGGALLSRRLTARRARAGLGQRSGDSGGEAAGQHPDTEDADGPGMGRGQTPVAAPGLKVNAFATGLKHPRWIHVLPNGDVLVAEATEARPGPPANVFDYAMVSTMKRAAAMGDSANRITLLRDTDGDGVAETQEVFLEGLNQPFGMAVLGRHFLCRQHRWRGCLSLHRGREPHHRARTEAGRRSSPAGIGRAAFCRALTGRSSMSASARPAISARRAWRPRRAAPPSTSSISQRGSSRIFAGGLRNAVGLAWEPSDRRALDGGQRARRPGRRDAARLSDLGARRRLLWLALLLLGADGGRPGAAGSGGGREGASRRTTRWAGTPRRWACAGCPPARFPAFRMAWRSGSTARGTAAS